MVVTARNSKNNSYPERVKRKKESNIKKERESDNTKRVYVVTLMSVSMYSRTPSLAFMFVQVLYLLVKRFSRTKGDD